MKKTDKKSIKKKTVAVAKKLKHPEVAKFLESMDEDRFDELDFPSDHPEPPTREQNHLVVIADNGRNLLFKCQVTGAIFFYEGGYFHRVRESLWGPHGEPFNEAMTKPFDFPKLFDNFGKYPHSKWEIFRNQK